MLHTCYLRKNVTKDLDLVLTFFLFLSCNIFLSVLAGSAETDACEVRGHRVRSCWRLKSSRTSAHSLLHSKHEHKHFLQPQKYVTRKIWCTNVNYVYLVLRIRCFRRRCLPSCRDQSLAQHAYSFFSVLN